MSLRPWLASAIAVLLLGGVAPLRAHAAMPSDTCDRLGRASRGFPGRLAYVLVDLEGGATCGAHADEEFAAASLDRLFVLAAAYQERERGTLSFTESLPLRADGVATGRPRPVMNRTSTPDTPEAPASPEAGEATTA